MFWPVLMGVFYVLFLLSLGSLLFRGEVGGWAWLSFLLAWIALSAFLHEVLNADIRVMWISLNSARTAFAVFTGLIEFRGFVVGGNASVIVHVRRQVSDSISFGFGRGIGFLLRVRIHWVCSDCIAQSVDFVF